MSFKTPDPVAFTKPVHKTPFFLKRGFLLTGAITSISIGVVVLAFSLFEAFSGGGNMRMVEVPGFHQLELKQPGLYAGVYQHRSAGPLPIEAISQLDVRLMSQDAYQDIPVLMNNTGQSFERFGVRGMPVFSFVVPTPGPYTLSAVYKEGGDKHPPINVMILPQTAQNLKQTLIVGIACLVFFVGLGIFILMHIKTWAPKSTDLKK